MVKPELAKTLRSQFKKAIRAVETNERIARDWLSWEKLFGTVQTVEQCSLIIDKEVKVMVEISSRDQV